MPSSEAAQRLVSGPAVSYSASDLLRAMTSGRSILLPQRLTNESAQGVVNRLFEFAKADSSPVVLVLGSDRGDYAPTMLVLDHVRLSPIPVLGVAVASLGTLRTALLQGCTWRFARRDTQFELSILGSWCDVTITLHAGVARAEAVDAMLQGAARVQGRLNALGALLASRSTLPAPEWVNRITKRQNASLDEALHFGLFDAIVD